MGTMLFGFLPGCFQSICVHQHVVFKKGIKGGILTKKKSNAPKKKEQPGRGQGRRQEGRNGGSEEGRKLVKPMSSMVSAVISAVSGAAEHWPAET